eukprot:6527090-Lingulodinium_polyedra.AAC.1
MVRDEVRENGKLGRAPVAHGQGRVLPPGRHGAAPAWGRAMAKAMALELRAELNATCQNAPASCYCQRSISSSGPAGPPASLGTPGRERTKTRRL